jgi:hypothetical protein
MTIKEDRNWRLNWTFDKILLGVLAFLAMKTYNSVDDAVHAVAELDKRQSIVEYRLMRIEAQITTNDQQNP